MKKFLSIILCVVMVASAFVACSKPANDADKTTTEAGETKVETTAEITTDSAKIKDADAVNLMKSYNAKALGLSDDDFKNCSFMVGSSGYEFDGAYYVKVIATIKNSHKDGDKEVFTFDNKGEYLISYDGKKILQRDMKAEEEKYSEMEVKEVPTTEAPTNVTVEVTKK